MNAPNQTTPNVSVEVRDLRKSFHGQAVLKGINLKVAPGQIFVIMGPSGSGKSILLKHLIGLVRPDSGEILIQGESIASPDIRDKYRMAMVFQSAALLTSLTVAENVGIYLSEHELYPPEEIARIVSAKLEVVGLKGEEARLPNELSGGMQKRVAIARALVIDPQLILLDEPTSELDPLMAVVVSLLPVVPAKLWKRSSEREGTKPLCALVTEMVLRTSELTASRKLSLKTSR